MNGNYAFHSEIPMGFSWPPYTLLKPVSDKEGQMAVNLCENSKRDLKEIGCQFGWFMIEYSSGC
jgi:hypothetical protein